MTTALARVAADVQTTRESIGAALQFVQGISTADQAADAYDRVRMAKEWARIRKVAAHIRADLLRLEIHCLRKMAQIGATESLSALHRNAAEFYREQTDEQIEELIRKYGDTSTSAHTIKKRATDANAYERGRQHALSGEYAGRAMTYSDREVDRHVAEYVANTSAALASIIDAFFEEGKQFGVAEVAEAVTDDTGLDKFPEDAGIRAGIAEVCRKALRDAPDVQIAGTIAPRFVTCLDRTSLGGLRDGQWIRVPFHAATVEQLYDMHELKERQVKEAQAARDKIAKLLDVFARAEQAARVQGMTLGELAATITLPNDGEQDVA